MYPVPYGTDNLYLDNFRWGESSISGMMSDESHPLTYDVLITYSLQPVFQKNGLRDFFISEAVQPSMNMSDMFSPPSSKNLNGQFKD